MINQGRAPSRDECIEHRGRQITQGTIIDDMEAIIEECPVITSRSQHGEHKPIESQSGDLS